MVAFDEACGYIFDCDGTLLDTLDAWATAEEMLFAAAGPLTEAQQDELHAAPFEEAARILHERYGVAESSQAILDHLEGYLMPFYSSHADPLPGARELVRSLASRGARCVVVSSSPQRYLRAGLEKAGILDCFCALVSTEDTGISKEDPAIYRHACEVLGCAPETVWAVEDAPYAIKVLGSCGINTLGVGNGCSDERRRELRACATAYAETLEDVL